MVQRDQQQPDDFINIFAHVRAITLARCLQLFPQLQKPGVHGCLSVGDSVKVGSTLLRQTPEQLSGFCSKLPNQGTSVKGPSLVDCLHTPNIIINVSGETIISAVLKFVDHIHPHNLVLGTLSGTFGPKDIRSRGKHACPIECLNNKVIPIVWRTPVGLISVKGRLTRHLGTRRSRQATNRTDRSVCFHGIQPILIQSLGPHELGCVSERADVRHIKINFCPINDVAFKRVSSNCLALAMICEDGNRNHQDAQSEHLHGGLPHFGVSPLSPPAQCYGSFLPVCPSLPTTVHPAPVRLPFSFLPITNPRSALIPIGGCTPFHGHCPIRASFPSRNHRFHSHRRYSLRHGHHVRHFSHQFATREI
ncbi:hypothetical protein FVE85_6951 [Porphyridium purpureum]|uniref:Uncharacterized protein n=1 Tax=Porphyridium purpureum TaxID=35688 RepID=A0A5J4Z6N4_PORPP|nr:hypothetical protein FVE85_6951 [Porphyridium purpureum]|eukprot:POR5637..scf295_1